MINTQFNPKENNNLPLNKTNQDENHNEASVERIDRSPKTDLPSLDPEEEEIDKVDTQDAEGNNTSKYVKFFTNAYRPSQQPRKDVDASLIANSEKIKELGVPRALVNKWLNIQQNKSKFKELRCQVDNKDDVSVYTETTYSKISSPCMHSALLAAKGAKFSNKNVASVFKKSKLSEKSFNIEPTKGQGVESRNTIRNQDSNELNRIPSLLNCHRESMERK